MMSTRASRLLHLLDRLRQARTAITADRLARDTGVSLRTLYRDIAELRRQGANIEGDAGVGYRLRAGFMLPPLMFDADELEALVLGMRWVKSQADEELSRAAERALGRISSTLPEHLRLAADTSGLFAPVLCENHAPEPWLPGLRHAIRLEHRLRLEYIDANGRMTRRVVWPFIMAFFGNVSRVFVAWCELRGEFRHFRADRVQTLLDTGTTYPVRRHELIRRWRDETGINPDGH
ncbi:MAG: YafY family protein [Lautropia sp.]|nr:YafY family protein [Lautropia sp.]